MPLLSGKACPQKLNQNNVIVHCVRQAVTSQDMVKQFLCGHLHPVSDISRLTLPCGQFFFCPSYVPAGRFPLATNDQRVWSCYNPCDARIQLLFCCDNALLKWRLLHCVRWTLAPCCCDIYHKIRQTTATITRASVSSRYKCLELNQFSIRI